MFVLLRIISVQVLFSKFKSKMVFWQDLVDIAKNHKTKLYFLDFV